MATPGLKIPKFDVVIDFSFMDLETPEDAAAESPRLRAVKAGKKPEIPRRQYTRVLRLNNNLMSELTGLSKLVNIFFMSISRVQWIDLSFNHIFKMPKELRLLKELKILYLHGNKISQFVDIEPLADLENLMKLTLHGNPVDSEKNYRTTILSILINLKNLDFSDVTPCDRFLAKKLQEYKERRRPKRYS